MHEIYSTKVHISLTSQTRMPGEFGQILGVLGDTSKLFFKN